MGIIYIILFAAFAIILIQNYSAFSYPISLYFFHLRTPPMPVGIWLIFLFVVGYIIGYIRSVPAAVKEFSKSREVKRLKRKIEQLETNLQKQGEVQAEVISEQPSEVLSSSSSTLASHSTAWKAEEEKKIDQ